MATEKSFKEKLISAGGSYNCLLPLAKSFTFRKLDMQITCCPDPIF